MAKEPAFHEDLTRGAKAKAGSERSFGIVFAVVFLVIGLIPLVGGGDLRIWSLAAAGAFLAVAAVKPSLLGPFNRLWFRLGTALHRVVTPAVMGLIFYLTVTPTALIMRLAGKDPLRLRFDAKAKSYWIERRPPGPDPHTMRNQY